MLYVTVSPPLATSHMVEQLFRVVPLRAPSYEGAAIIQPVDVFCQDIDPIHRPEKLG